MSVRVMSWVWESSRSAGIDRLVMLAIADAAADHGGDAWPSVATLARKAGVGTRTVQRSVRALVALGELQMKPNAGRNGVNVYRVVMRQYDTPANESPRQNDTPSEIHPASETLGGVNDDINPRQPDTRTIQEPSLPTPLIKTGAELVPIRQDIERVCERLRAAIIANGGHATVTAKWRDTARLIFDRDKRTEAQFNAAVDWCQNDTFWQSVILSMDKLRKHWEAMSAAARQQSAPVKSRHQRESDGILEGFARRTGVIA